MGDNRSHIPLYDRSPLYQLFVSLLVILGVGLFLFIISLPAGKLLFHSDLGVFENSSTAVGRNDIAFLKYVLILQDILLFIVPSIILLFLLKLHDQTRLKLMKIPQINEVFLVILLAFCIFPITSFTGQLNSSLHLPDWLSGVEDWMTEKEDNATRVIEFCMTSDTFWDMMLNVFVVAVMPSIGEELIFRGVIQKVFSNIFRSGHLAIWMTAFVFSAIHFQFYGFIPRFILGLIFGYLFFWSGKLWLPIITHFVNNAVPTIGAYITGLEKFNTTSDYPLLRQLIILPLPIVLSLLILLYFRNRSKPDTRKEMEHSPPVNN